MNDCQDLSDLQRHFDHRFESVHLSLAVRGGLYDDDKVEEISSEVLKLRKQVTDLSTELTKWKKQLQEYKKMLPLILELTNILSHAQDNLPTHLPKLLPVPTRKPDVPAPIVDKPKINYDSVPPLDCDLYMDLGVIPFTETPYQKKQVLSDICNTIAPQVNRIVQQNTMAPTGDRIREPKNKVITQVKPVIAYLTVEEFAKVPKYMKGRILYEQVNNLIDELNQVYFTKHNLLKMPASKRTVMQKREYQTFKQHDMKETKGLHYITEGDIKKHSKLRMDKFNHSVFTILRHCNRIREQRGGGVTRYVYIDC